MVEEEITDGNRIATILTAELRNRDSGGYGRIAVREHEAVVVVEQTTPCRRELGRYRPASTEGLVVTFADETTRQIHRAADSKAVADAFLDRLD